MWQKLRIDHGRMLVLLELEGQLLTVATHDAGPDLPVAGVSGRTLGETVDHLGELYEDALSWMGVVEQAEGNGQTPDRTDLGERTGIFAARLNDLLAEFSARPADQPCPGWWPHDRTVGFWLRRMVHATTVHRVDVQNAAGIEMTPIDEEVALDGIDEALRLWFEYRLNALGVTASRRCTVEVSAEGWIWRATAQSDRMRVSGPAEESTVDALVRGDPAEVFLWLWGRVPDRAVDTIGDPDAIAQLWSLLRLAMRR